MTCYFGSLEKYGQGLLCLLHHCFPELKTLVLALLFHELNHCFLQPRHCFKASEAMVGCMVFKCGVHTWPGQ